MKKTLILVFAALLTAAAVGCNKIQDTVNSIQEGVSSEAASGSENEIDQEDIVTNKKEKNKITTSNKKNKIKKDPDSSSQDDSSKNEDSNDSQGSGGNDTSVYLANEIYQNAVSMYSRVILNCPYELDYDDTDSNGFAAIIDPDVSGTDDIVSKYCTVFAEPDSYIYEKYIEKDGKVYYNDATRGSNIYYDGTDLEYVSGDEDSMTFNAVSHYRDPETGEYLEDKTAVFSVKMTDDGYKVTEFKYPQ